MTRRLVTVLTVATAAIGLTIAPAAAHFNEAAGKAAGPPGHAAVWETPGLGHDGMECGAEMEQTPLVPLGLDCPAQR